jgi:hypothetical protein
MSKVFKSATNKVKKFAKGQLNFVTGLATGDLSKATSGVKDSLSVSTGLDTAKSIGKEVQRGIADISGAKAAQDQLNMQNQLAKQEARRQALLSDAMAREAGGEGADVRLGRDASKRRKNFSSSTGIAGAGSSRQTGVQG